MLGDFKEEFALKRNLYQTISNFKAIKNGLPPLGERPFLDLKPTVIPWLLSD